MTREAASTSSALALAPAPYLRTAWPPRHRVARDVDLVRTLRNGRAQPWSVAGLIRTALAVLIRPWLWPSALRFVPDRWWTYPPYLPIPPKKYREFRLETMYGDKHHPLVAKDTVAFLNWCRRAHKEGRKT